MEQIIVTEAKTHHLKNISLNLPLNHIIMVTGKSGAGKSSLVFDTIHLEAYRRYAESLSSFTRLHLAKLSKPLVKSIEHLPPSIALGQASFLSNKKTTVGSLTELLDIFKELFQLIGKPFCSHCKTPMIIWSAKELIEAIEFKNTNGYICIAACLQLSSLSHWQMLKQIFLKQGFSKILHPSGIISLLEEEEFSEQIKIKYLLIDRVHLYSEDSIRLSVALETSFKISSGPIGIFFEDLQSFRMFSKDLSCPRCIFGNKQQSLTIFYLWGHTLDQICDMSLLELKKLMDANVPEERIEDNHDVIVKSFFEEARNKLKYLKQVSVDYLSLNREAISLSGGERQRIHLAKLVSQELTQSLFCLDEPSWGLHQKDINKLMEVILNLKEQGNTLLIVEHDRHMLQYADIVIEMGEGAGIYGGKILQITDGKSFAFQQENLRKRQFFSKTKKDLKEWIKISDLSVHSIKNASFKIPVHALTVICGVSGSGKSSLIKYGLLELFEAYKHSLIKDEKTAQIGPFFILDQIIGISYVSQQPLATQSRSNLVTYLGLFDLIRELFASEKVAKQAGFKKNDFSFNHGRGRCEECLGLGFITEDLGFLGELSLTCESCFGKRFKQEILNVTYMEKNILDVLEMTIDEAIKFFKWSKVIFEPMKNLQKLGLGHLSLGQSLSTISSGEAQRLKLACEFMDKNSFSSHLIILDEPSTGLSDFDVRLLLDQAEELIQMGHTVIIIEHHEDVIAAADWIIEMGEGSGPRGGKIIYQGQLIK